MFWHLITFRWWVVKASYRGVDVDYYAPSGFLCKLLGHSKKYYEWELCHFCARCGAQTNVDDMLG